MWPLLKYDWACDYTTERDCTSKFIFYEAGIENHYFIQAERKSHASPAGCPEYSWLGWSNEECAGAPFEFDPPDDNLAEILQVSSEERGLWRIQQYYDYDRYTGVPCTYFNIYAAEDPDSNSPPGACVENGFKIDYKDASIPTNVGMGTGFTMSRMMMLGIYDPQASLNSIPYCS